MMTALQGGAIKIPGSFRHAKTLPCLFNQLRHHPHLIKEADGEGGLLSWASHTHTRGDVHYLTAKSILFSCVQVLVPLLRIFIPV